MKRLLLLFIMLNSFFVVFCQSENDKIIDINEVITLEEVIIIAPKLREKRSVTVCCSFWTTRCCSSLSEVKVEAEEILKTDSNEIVLFPNPSSNGFFNLKIKENYSLLQIEVSSITGQSILSKTLQNVNNKVSLNLSQYPSGIYLINIIADGKRLPTKKAIRG